MRKNILLLIASSCLALPFASTDAATVGYWRFENPADLGEDSGTNGLDLTNTGVTSVASPFLNPVPETGASNLGAGNFESSESDRLTIADSSAFNFQDFTIEAFIRLDVSNDQTRTIAGQLSTSSNSAWQLAITSENSGLGARNLLLQVSSNGSALNNLDSNIQLTLGTNYYIAASTSFSVSGVSTTFYVQDLSTTTLQTSVATNGSVTLLHDSSANFGLGTSYTGATPGRFFDGLIDEVRLSNEALSGTSLLVVPEPSAVMMLAGGFLALFTRRRPASRQ